MCKKCGGCSGSIYGLGFLGAVIYYFSTATSFGVGAIGFFKALVWPGFVVYGIMAFLGL